MRIWATSLQLIKKFLVRKELEKIRGVKISIHLFFFKHAHGGVRNSDYRSIVSNTNTFESKDARDWYNILNGVHRLNVHIYWDLIVPAICWYFFMPKNRGEYGEVRRLAKEQYEYGSNDSFLSSMLYYGYKTRVK